MYTLKLGRARPNIELVCLYLLPSGSSGEARLVQGGGGRGGGGGEGVGRWKNWPP